MTEMMTRFLGLRSLAVERQADISMLDIHEGDWVVYDVLGASLQVT